MRRKKRNTKRSLFKFFYAESLYLLLDDPSLGGVFSIDQLQEFFDM
jgi:hypothetical protein